MLKQQCAYTDKFISIRIIYQLLIPAAR